ncbi:MAG: beta-galactosidase [Armatimonadota bacterium]|nr:beta-galactosidase [Armatimonadota bacterium]
MPHGAFDKAGPEALKGWSGAHNAKLVEENGNRFLRFVNDDADKVVNIETRLRLEPTWKTLRFSGRLRATVTGLGKERWYGARLTQQFLNAAGQVIQPYPPQPSLRETSTNWVEFAHEVKLPDQAVTWQLTPGLWGTAGTLDLDDLKFEVVEAVGGAETARDAPLPAGAKGTFEQAETISATRARLALNGLWRFLPDQAGTGREIPERGWGWMPVPGNWLRGTRQDGLLKGVVAAGEGPLWQAGRGGPLDWKQVRRGWYQQQVKIPADWQGRDIILNVGRVATDATVFVNGREAGKVNWPEGTVNLTNFVKPGEAAMLTFLVVATLTKSEVMQLMGYENAAANPTTQAQLQSAGLVGNVWLDAMPRGARLDSVWVQTSTRRGELSVQAETSGVAVGQTLPLRATVLDSAGKTVKEWTAQAKVETVNGSPVVRAAWKWPDAKLWEVGQPNLYALKLAAQGAGVNDELTQRFGFREFWIEGRKLFLNGKEFRMRPNLVDFVPDQRQKLQKLMEWGFNFGEFWPNDLNERSNPAEYRASEFYRAADEVGLPISGIMPHMGWMGSQFDTPQKQAAFEANAQRDWREGRNHPAILMWGSSGNMTGGALDPAIFGQRAVAAPFMTSRSADYAKSMRLGAQGIGIIKRYDPTRPVFIHHGGAIGDLYTLNLYLTGIPLQEREEWLTHYVQKGDMPLWFVEWGTPHATDFFRGRKGYGPSIVTEPLHTEHYAIYFGPDAYRLETKAYRDEIRGRFKGGQEYDQFHENWAIVESPAFLKLQALFQTNTLRAYRTFGMSGGTIPWSGGYAERNGKITPAGEAMRANNGPTLAWIAGPARAGDVAAFTDKTHLYNAGERVEKRVAILNDSRQTQPYEMSWTATVDGKTAGSGTARGTIETGSTKFEALGFALPTTTAGKTTGEIVATVKIGGNTHTDRFGFSVFSAAAQARGEVAVYDPKGLTTAMLKAQGYTVSNWQRGGKPQVLVIGREALSSSQDGAAMLKEVEAYVRGGGRAIIFNQNPQWVRDYLGLRVSHKQMRRVFPVPGAHPVTAGLDADDLRDWRGKSTLLDPYPDYINGKGADERIQPESHQPTWGWRMGNRHTVSSTSVEKPHRSGWRPILEDDFDLAYTPLMELDYGNGKVLWCALDLEERADSDPAAKRIAQRVLDYARTAPLAPRVKTYYVGGEAGRKMLDALGVDYAAVNAIPADAKLLVYGPDATPDAAQLETFARNGGKVLFLARRTASGALGAQLSENTKFTGSLDVPDWPEARGLSASDLRFRNEATAWLIQNAEGAEIGAEGLLARRVVGQGVLLWAQLDPELLNADEKTYLRYTRWRQTRALSQLLANLGASFARDDRVFHAVRAPQALEIPLAGNWQAKLVRRLDAAPTSDKGHADPGISEAARALVGGKVDTTGWTNAVMPQAMEALGGAWANADGEAVFRTTVEVPAELRGRELILSFGSLDDFDEVFFNGVSIGKTGEETPLWWGVKRNYTVPAALIRPGANSIAVRIWDRFGGGGFTGRPDELKLAPRVEKTELAPGLYHADYREDFEMGDDPHRYYNW